MNHSNYRRDISSNAIVATDKNMLEQHRKQLNERTVINNLKRDIQDLKTQLNLIFKLLKDKE